ncbi:MAG TPA: MerR family transcriptional regulator [Caulobacteraceae bacterium]|nr:MerR family transcriptional regulator [Caulobacteraceae bacterium]
MAKGPQAFRTISEAADEVGVAQHVLRFWESKFAFIRPMKLTGGRRFYRPQDIAVLASIRQLLHERGYTIKGVQKLHREQGLKGLEAAVDSPEGAPRGPITLDAAALARLRQALAGLEAARARLDAVLGRHRQSSSASADAGAVGPET